MWRDGGNCKTGSGKEQDVGLVALAVDEVRTQNDVDRSCAKKWRPDELGRHYGLRVKGSPVFGRPDLSLGRDLLKDPDWPF